MENTGTYQKIERLVDPSKWPTELKNAIESGDYIFRRLAGNWIILISLKLEDYIEQGGRRKTPGRLAIRFSDGRTMTCPPGIRISDWEAELAGKLDEWREKELQHQRESEIEIERFLKGEAPLKNWDGMGDPIPGILKHQEENGGE
ncbi:MAG: hypothetical protein IH872_01345 [Chloroflexi bacterium]|nr:hypothetical protein [Chloroflexota bacterium]